MKNTILFMLSVLVVMSCSSNTDIDGISQKLRGLVDVGYSIKELSIRTDYTESELVAAYQSDDIVLKDSVKNAKIEQIYELNDDEKIIPVNKTNISAYNGIWQVYTKAQNLPRTSLYTGIGVTKVACALMKRKPLTEDDSIRALVGYVNMKYNLEDMPPTIDKYYTKTTTLNDLVVPKSFSPNYTDEVKMKIDYYIYQNEQLELKANYNLKRSIDNKIDGHIKDAVDRFIDDDVNSWKASITSIWNDSTEIADTYKQKLQEKLDLNALNKSVRDEIIAYCVSVNCSRAILINEVLNYKEYSGSIDVSDSVSLRKYVANLEALTNIMEKKKDNIAIDAGIFSVTIPLQMWTAGVVNPASTMFSLQAAKVFLYETAAWTGLDHTIKGAFNYEKNEKEIESSTKQMQNAIKTDLNKKMSKALNKKGNYYDSLNNNTKKYYQEVRNFFQIN